MFNLKKSIDFKKASVSDVGEGMGTIQPGCLISKKSDFDFRKSQGNENRMSENGGKIMYERILYANKDE